MREYENGYYNIYTPFEKEPTLVRCYYSKGLKCRVFESNTSDKTEIVPINEIPSSSTIKKVDIVEHKEEEKSGYETCIKVASGVYINESSMKAAFKKQQASTPTNQVLEIEFTKEIPEKVDIDDDNRQYLFFYHGKIKVGRHYEKNLFLDAEEEEVFEAESWREYKEVSKGEEE